MTDAARRGRVAAAVVAVAAGAAVFLVATTVFPYHSVNDDEGVYLLQAAMLLDGRLLLRPGALGDLVRPWFFVADRSAAGLVFYPKYAPVAAAVFAFGVAAGDAHLALAAVAAGNALLVYALTAAAYDRRTGVLAALLLVGSPLYLLTSSVFLAYAPTTLFTLSFAYAYVRACRTSRLRDAATAGVAIGIAFFSRPYTAVLFASPFVAHALLAFRRTRGTDRFDEVLRRTLAVALPGLAFVAVTLGYNALLTGHPLLFPYEAFAPRDGLGFGRRAILGYERVYTPGLAAATTGRVLALLATSWTAAGPIGAGLALVGFAAALREGSERLAPDRTDGVGSPSGTGAGPLPDSELRLLFAGVAVAVVLGNAYFWGTMNGLQNGLVQLLGPYYHFDLLLPLSAFGAAAALSLLRRFTAAVHGTFTPRTAWLALAVVLAVTAPVVAATEAAVVGDPVAENRERTRALAATYEPFERTDLERAVVLVPDPYGDWLQHPFQYLRNDPDLDGETLYVRDEDAAAVVRAIAASPDRSPYRFTYRGRWTGATDPVESRLTPLAVRRGDAVVLTSRLGVPAGATSASIRLETADGYARYRVPSRALGDSLVVEWRVDDTAAEALNRTVVGGESPARLPADPTTVTLFVTFTEPSGATVTYRQSVTVAPTGDGVRVVVPPETRVCRLQLDCGREGTYVGPDGEYLTGVSVETAARARNDSG